MYVGYQLVDERISGGHCPCLEIACNGSDRYRQNGLDAHFAGGTYRDVAITEEGALWQE